VPDHYFCLDVTGFCPCRLDFYRKSLFLVHGEFIGNNPLKIGLILFPGADPKKKCTFLHLF